MTPSASTVPAMVARRVAAAPAAPALRTDREVVSYAALDGRAGALAARLLPLVRGDEPVLALLLPRGVDLVVAMLAAWRAGCAFSPIDPHDPPARISYLVGDLGACAVVTDDPARLPADLGVPVLPPAGATGPPAALPQLPELPEPDDTAYVLYTSGSTGPAKGVPISHRGLAQVVSWCVQELAIGPVDSCSQVASPGFDAAQLETWPCLASGACLLPYCPPDDPATESAVPELAIPELAGWLAATGVTRAFLPTPLAEAVWASPVRLPRLRSMLIGAAALRRRPPADLPYPVHNLYGPTECAILATSHRVTASGPLNVIGRPIPGARVDVLDEDGEPCPAGVAGELHIGGAGVARGYWRRPGLSQQRFLPSAPGGGPGPVYRTGDRGRRLPDGTLEFLGRLDRQIELRGYRIEPGEVEARLHTDPLVAAALVRAVPGAAGAPDRLVAYLVPRLGADPDGPAVLARLAGSLPRHLVPDAAVWLEQLPLTGRGKVDESRLPGLSRADLGRTAFLAPQNELERRIAAVWARVLGIDRVGAQDAFFDLGGSSLLLFTLRAELQAELGVPVPVQRLFEHPTVRALAASLAGGSAPAGPDAQARTRADLARRARAARKPVP